MICLSLTRYTKRAHLMSKLLHNRARASQQIIFDGIGKGRIYPGDVDLKMSLDGLLFIYGEIKTKGARVPTGQRRDLTDTINVLRRGGGVAFAFVADHTHPVPDDIVAAECIIREVYDGVRWSPASDVINVANFINRLIDETMAINDEYHQRLLRFK